MIAGRDKNFRDEHEDGKLQMHIKVAQMLQKCDFILFRPFYKQKTCYLLPNPRLRTQNFYCKVSHCNLHTLSAKVLFGQKATFAVYCYDLILFFCSCDSYVASGVPEHFTI